MSHQVMYVCHVDAKFTLWKSEQTLLLVYYPIISGKQE
jgi:hypothetical protein